jgi:copper transport protein
LKRRLELGGATLALAMMLVLAFGLPASAHAQLLSTNPVNNAALAKSPTEVEVTFGEHVELPPGSLRVYNTNDIRVDTGTAHHPGGDEHSVAIGVHHLSPGGYVATWRVISADTHPVHGAFTFTVGNAEDAGNTGNNTSALAHHLLVQGKSPSDVGVVYAGFRTLLVASVVILIGSITVGLYFLNSPDLLVQRVFRWSLLLVLIATAGIYALQGVYAATFGLTDVLDWTVLSATIHTSLGYASIVRVALLGALAVANYRCGWRQRRMIKLIYAALALGVICTMTLSGHGATGRWIPLAVVADLIHVASASMWAGALVIIAVIWRQSKEDVLGRLTSRFSATALIAVIALTLTGTFQAWRQLRTWHALFHSGYGQILIVKVLIVVVMVTLGWFGRRHLANLAYLRKSLRVEAGLSVFVFVATALLMDAAPTASTGYHPYSGQFTVGTTVVDVIVDPDRVGLNSVHFYTLSEEGEPVDVAELTASLTLPAKNIGPVPIQLAKLDAGHFSSDSFNVPIAGKWELDTTVRTSDIDESTTQTNVSFHK